MKTLAYHFSDPVYKTGHSFIAGGDPNKAVLKWSNYWNFEISNLKERYVNDVAAFTLFPGRGSGVNSALIWLPTIPKTIRDHAVLVHETLHVTVGILTRLGMEFTNEASEETFCYHQEWLVYTLLTRVKKG